MTDVLYAARGGSATTSDLYTIDPVTAVASSVGASGVGLTGLAVDPTTGNLYGSTNTNSSSHPNAFCSINTSTGLATHIANWSTGSVIDLAFDSTGQLWGLNNGTWFCKIDKSTGAMTVVGSNDVGSPQGGASSFTDADVLWSFVTQSGEAYTINTTTGVSTAVWNPANQGTLVHSFNRVQAGTFDSSNLFWGIVASTELAMFNVGTGVWARVGTLSGSANWDALAWSAAPPGDVTPPTRTSLAVSGNKVTIGYDEALQTSPGPSTSEFAVKINGAAVAVSAATVVDLPGPLVDQGVQLTLAATASPGDTVLVSYTG